MENKLIDRHQTAIEILEAIIYFRSRTRTLDERINGFSGMFPDLRRKYTNDLDTAQRCITRLYSRYHKLMEAK